MSSAARVRVVDAFTDRPFSGNPAAVCVLETHGWPADRWMRDVAREMNLPMTAFAHPLASNEYADWGLRWFNTVLEERLCGHATLATVHALHRDGLIGNEVRFATLSGVLSARAGHDGCITLDFPAGTVSELPPWQELELALGAEAIGAFDTGELGDVMVVFDDEPTVRALAPDMSALARLTTAHDRRGVIATAPAPASEAYDFVSRFFAPAHGLPEDPVTGSAHTALAPYWSGVLGPDELVGLQVSARTGIVHTALREDRVHLTGRAVTVLEGNLEPGA